MSSDQNLPEIIPVVIIAGPTASGKSSLALSLAEEFDGEIINADSMQVYRELRILTARPNPEDEARIPHHLYGDISIADGCSAGAWLDLALPCIKDIHSRGHLPIVCGGTGLYLKVLMEGIAPVPDVPRDAIDEAGSLYDEIGGEDFRARLAEIDREGAERLESGDRQRMIRAYAVARTTGKTLSDWQAGQMHGPPLPARFLSIELIPPRDQLYARIESRFDQMMDEGALDEVQALGAFNLDPALPALKALGVPEFRRFLADESALEDAIQKAKQTTRNFAKRQLTWFRNQTQADLVIEDFATDDTIAMAVTVVSQLKKQIDAK